MPASPSKRILIYGVCGSGKTTFARRLSEQVGIPWHSVDDIAWLPGWVMRPDVEQTALFEEICAGDSWILDTAYWKWIDVVLPRTDLIVGLDYPRWFSFFRLLRRTLARVTDKKEICNGNVESLRTMLSRNSILVWHFQSFQRKRQRLRQWEENSQGPRVITFKSAKQAEKWLASIQPEDL